MYKKLKCILVGIMLASCTNSSPQTGDILRLAFANEPRSGDPHIAMDCHSCNLLTMLREGLLRLDSSGAPVPGVAETYTCSPDGKTYVFSLRKSVWSNGDPVTAHDFVASWQRAASPEYCIGALFLNCLKNYSKALQGEVPPSDIGVTAKDDYTLIVELEYPVPTFPELVTLSSYFPIHPKEPASITNGPFSLVKWAPHDAITMEKNPLYWDVASVRLAGAEIALIPEANTQIQLFEQGKLDWLGSSFCYLPTDSLEDLDRRFGLQEHPSAWVSWIIVNVDKPPFSNKKIRQAFSYAINRQVVAETLLRRRACAHMGLVPPLMAFQEAPYFGDGDLETARRLFEEGLEELEMEALPPLTLECPNEEARYQLSQVLQRDWESAFNVAVQAGKQDWKMFHERVATGQYQLACVNWVCYANDPIWFLDIFKAKRGSFNFSRWENPSYRDLLDSALACVDSQARRQLMHQAEALLVDEMPIIPLFNITDLHVQNPNLQGMSPAPFGIIDVKGAYFNH